jgi:DNA primase
MHSFTEKVKFLESIFGKGSLGRTGNLDVWCPICNQPDKKKKKLAIKVETDLVHCWVCGYHSKSLKHLLLKLGHKSDFERYKNEFAFDKKSLITIKEDIQLNKVELPKDFKLLTEARINPFTKALVTYVTSRGLTIDDMWYYKLGYSNDTRWQRKVLVPSFDGQGDLNYFLGRSIDKKSYKRYDNPEVEKTDIIFNEVNIDWNKELILVEGVFDLFKCPSNTVPLLGSELDETYSIFWNVTEYKTPIVLLLDDDTKYTKTLKIASLLSSYGVSVKIADLPSGADPGSLTKSEIKEHIKSANDFSWDFVFKRKLERASKTTLNLKVEKYATSDMG